MTAPIAPDAAKDIGRDRIPAPTIVYKQESTGMRGMRPRKTGSVFRNGFLLVSVLTTGVECGGDRGTGGIVVVLSLELEIGASYWLG